MSDMPMPGGAPMSMAWMPVAGQTWLGAATWFLAVWAVMMAAMMLPSLVPALWRLRRALAGGGASRSGWLTGLAGTAYLVVWTLAGATVYPLGAALAALEMRQPLLARAVPAAAATVVLLAGVLQFSAWKARHLACCRYALEAPVPAANAWQAIRLGLRLGVHCTYCCAGLVAMLLVIGMTDLRAMALVTVAVTAERLLPAGDRVAKGLGIVIVAAGLLLARRAAAGLGMSG
jgi:predicted metal-binding membrane protein